MNDQDKYQKSGLSFLAELLIGGVLGFSILSNFEVSTHQINECQKLANAVSFLLLTMGVIFKKQNNTLIKKSGNMIMSLGVLLIGAGSALMIKVYARS